MSLPLNHQTELNLWFDNITFIGAHYQRRLTNISLLSPPFSFMLQTFLHLLLHLIRHVDKKEIIKTEKLHIQQDNETFMSRHMKRSVELSEQTMTLECPAANNC
ncbi:CLUMA_CG021595, isoform A [Clunio marinus]|uniref:CLUMA_CG021595, isoform A n=1 Tax=Clunio marinus TaxID=568069 RepID=A0A1J1J7Y0_9DIPT|nr:CLUMA_CG021595, isoform A [Clunio marinus]